MQEDETWFPDSSFRIHLLCLLEDPSHCLGINTLIITAPSSSSSSIGQTDYNSRTNLSSLYLLLPFQKHTYLPNLPTQFDINKSTIDNHVPPKTHLNRSPRRRYRSDNSSGTSIASNLMVTTRQRTSTSTVPADPGRGGPSSWVLQSLS